MKTYLLTIISLFVSLHTSAQYDPNYDQIADVDFLTVDADVTILPEIKQVSGEAKYQFSILKNTDSVFLDAKDMQFKQVLLDGKKVKFTEVENRLWIVSNFKKNSKYSLGISYAAKPEKAMYFINWDIKEKIESKQVWTQGQGKYTSHWLPSFDDMREKAIFNLSISFKDGYEVISNGELKDKIQLNDSLVQWSYRMEKPMSSYLVAIAAGKFKVFEDSSKSGVPTYNYYLPSDSLLVEPTYRHSAHIFNFLEEELGVRYPWQNYKQIPVQDFLYSGMENTGATIFSSSFMVDSVAFNDINYINVNAHELAHQWFGNYITETNGPHHWLHEGFSTYYALLAERDIFGDDYFYWKLYESAEQLKALSDQGKGQALLSSNASSLTYYQKGAWALHILKELIGEDAFNTAIKNFLLNNEYATVTTNELIVEIEKVTDIDIGNWVQDWLEQSAFQGTAALKSLTRSNFIQDYMEVAGLREVAFNNKKEILSQAIEFPVNDYIGQEVVFQLEGETGAYVNELYKKAFDSNNLYVRQAIAISINHIPSELKGDFMGLLKDDSYITIENALLKLWMQFPEETTSLLELTENIEGLPSKNVRLLWLTINLVSPQVAFEQKQAYYEELSGYTNTHYPFEVRQNAFGYLYQINTFTQQNLKDLLQASQHHNYRFRDFSRKLLDKLLENKEYHEKYVDLVKQLSVEDRNFLNNRLNN